MVVIHELLLRYIGVTEHGVLRARSCARVVGVFPVDCLVVEDRTSVLIDYGGVYGGPSLARMSFLDCLDYQRRAGLSDRLLLAGCSGSRGSVGVSGCAAVAEVAIDGLGIVPPRDLGAGLGIGDLVREFGWFLTRDSFDYWCAYCGIPRRAEA